MPKARDELDRRIFGVEPEERVVTFSHMRSALIVGWACSTPDLKHVGGRIAALQLLLDPVNALHGREWMHAAQAADEARVWPQEYKPGSNRSPRPGAKKAEKEIVIANRLGLHARPAALFAQVANRFRADVWLEKNGTGSMAKAFWAS